MPEIYMIKLTKDLEAFFYQLNQDGHSIPTIKGFDCYYSNKHLIYRKKVDGLTFEKLLSVNDIHKCQVDDYYNIRHVVNTAFSHAYAGYLAREYGYGV